MGTKRLTYVETLRGLACVLLVSWHVVGMDTTDGMELPMDHPLHQFGFFFLPLRMPLFAFISGYVFNALVRDKNELSEKLSTKARRLLLPLVFVGTAHFLLRGAVYGVPLDKIWHVYFDLYQHFWYLNASFVLMVSLLVVSFFLKDRAKTAALACFGVFCVLYLLDWELHPINWFAITKATYIGAFFYLGQVFRTVRAEQTLHAAGPQRMWIIGGLLALIAVLYYFRETGPYLEKVSADVQSWQSLVLSLALVTLLFAVRWENKWLALLGPYSYAIFLFHVMFTGGLRAVELKFFPNESPYLMWICGLAIGLLAPIGIQKLLERGPALLRTCFLGVRYAPTKSKSVGAGAAAQSEPAG